MNKRRMELIGLVVRAVVLAVVIWSQVEFIRGMRARWILHQQVEEMEKARQSK